MQNCSKKTAQLEKMNHVVAREHCKDQTRVFTTTVPRMLKLKICKTNYKPLTKSIYLDMK